MTLWLVLDGPHCTSGTYYLSELEARRVAAARNKALGFAEAHPDSRVVRAETVEPAGPLFRDEAAALLASSGDGTAQ